MKKISIIIPTYNRPQMLQRALFSIQTENKDAIEVVVCDDLSEEKNIENNKSVIMEVSAQIGIEIKYSENTRIKGVSGARNYAIEQSNGEWLLFLDDDDAFADNYIDKVLDYLTMHKEVDLFWSNVIISKKINSKEVRVKKYFTPKTKGELYRDFISIGLGYGVVIKKKAIVECGLFDEKLRVAEDTDLFFKFIQSNKIIANLPCFGVVLFEHDLEKLSKTYDYHARNHIFKTLFRRYFLSIKKSDLLYISFSSWIVNVYKQSGMKKEALIFCFEFWIKKFYSLLVNKQFLFELKNLRWR